MIRFTRRRFIQGAAAMAAGGTMAGGALAHDDERASCEGARDLHLVNGRFLTMDPRRPLVSDPVYSSPLVTQLVNKVLKDGKRSLAERIVYAALEGTRRGDLPCSSRRHPHRDCLAHRDDGRCTG